MQEKKLKQSENKMRFIMGVPKRYEITETKIVIKNNNSSTFDRNELMKLLRTDNDGTKHYEVKEDNPYVTYK